MEIKPTPQVLLKFPHNSVVATFQDPNKHSWKLVMFSFQNQRSSQTVTPTVSANSTLLSPLHCYSLRPAPCHLPNQLHILPPKPALFLPPHKHTACTSREPAPYSCPTSSSVAPCTAHLHCENAKNWGAGPARDCSRHTISQIFAALLPLSWFTVPCSWSTWPCSPAVPVPWGLRWQRNELIQPGASHHLATCGCQHIKRPIRRCKPAYRSPSPTM